MRQTNEKVYRCDHCNKAIVSKGSMVVHEKFCRNNPRNKHKCLQQCVHLLVESIGYDADSESMPHKDFFCTVTGIRTPIHSYRMERFKSKKSRIENSLRMPLECSDYSDQIEIDDFFKYKPDEFC